jgi:sirohydrochlorin cobaltochelatase
MSAAENFQTGDGLLLFAHGARDPAWSVPFEGVARRIAAERPDLPMALAYLEFMSPGFEEAAEALIAQGVCRIHIVPMFLGASGHVRRDIPPLIAQLQARHGPAVQWHLHAAIGEQDAVMQAMADAGLQLLDSSAALLRGEARP